MRLFYRNSWAYLYINRRKTIALHTKDTVQAEAMKAEFEERLLSAKLDAVRGKTSAGTMTISGLSEKYCARSKGKKPLSPESLKKDKLVLKLFAEAVDDIPVRNIDHKTVDDFESACRARGMTNDGIASYLRHLKAALRWAAKDKQRFIDRVPQIDIPSEDKERPLEFRLIDRKDILRLIDEAKEQRGERFGVLIDLYASTGCRRREAVELMPERVFLQGKKAFVEIVGKGKRGRRLYIPPYLRKDIRKLAKEEGRLFPWHRDTVSHWFEECAEALELSCRLHDLRHTWITRMLERGVSVQIVQVLAGHSKITTTERYMHIVEEIRAREIEDKVFRKYGRV